MKLCQSNKLFRDTVTWMCDCIHLGLLRPFVYDAFSFLCKGDPFKDSYFLQVILPKPTKPRCAVLSFHSPLCNDLALKFEATYCSKAGACLLRSWSSGHSPLPSRRRLDWESEKGSIGWRDVLGPPQLVNMAARSIRPVFQVEAFL